MQSLADTLDIQVQNETLSLKANNAPLGKVLKEISDKAHFKFSFFGTIQEPITTSFENIPLSDGIRRLLGKRSYVIIYDNEQQTPQNLDTKVKEQARIIGIWVSAANDMDSPGRSNRYIENKQFSAQIQAEVPTVSPDQAVSESNQEKRIAVDNWKEIITERKDKQAIKQAIDELAGIGDNDALEVIANAYGHDDESIRIYAVESIRQINKLRAIVLLGQALNGDSSYNVRKAALDALAYYESEAAKAFIAGAAKDPDKRIRASASRILGIVE